MVKLTDLKEFIQDIDTNDDKEFIAAILKLLKALILLFNSYPGLQEEFKEYEEIYQITLKDLNVHYWLKLSQGKLSYELGENENRSIIFYLTKDVFIQIMQQKILAIDAFMRGKITVEGGLRYAIQFKNILNSLIRYMVFTIDKGFEKN